MAHAHLFDGDAVSLLQMFESALTVPKLSKMIGQKIGRLQA